MAERAKRPKASEIVRVTAEGVDEAEVIRRVEENLARHQSEWGAESFIPSYDDLLEEGEEEEKKPGGALEYYLWRLRDTDVAVGRYIIPSKLPILGRAIDLLKQQFHNLVLYHVNILAAKQVMFNVQSTRALRHLRREVEALKKSVGEQQVKSVGKPEENA